MTKDEEHEPTKTTRAYTLYGTQLPPLTFFHSFLHFAFFRIPDAAPANSSLYFARTLSDI